MKERLSLFMQEIRISPAQFAQKTGIQRSSISHILSGRNKPSYDFLLKIMENFPVLNIEWMLNGNGKMLKSDDTETIKSIEKDVDQADDLFTNDETKNADIKSFIASGNHEIKLGIENENHDRSKDVYKSKYADTDKAIEKIIILYQDKTFNDYTPR